MMTRRGFITALLAAAAVAAVSLAQVARADKKKKAHDDAWSAREGGTILPLAKVLDMVRPKIDGEIIETEFENEHGRLVYEFKYVDRNGHVRELYADARTGVILMDKPD